MTVAARELIASFTTTAVISVVRVTRADSQSYAFLTVLP